MKRRFGTVLAGFFGLATLAVSAIPVVAQMQEIKPKPPMYSYVANWQVPRANWSEIDKAAAPVQSVMQKAMDSGEIIGYGSDTSLVHTVDGATHDTWWSSMSLGSLVKVQEEARAASQAGSLAFNSAKHWDHILVSRYYNWKPGSQKGGYTLGMDYVLKADAPDDALENLSQHFIVPVLEKLLADGHLIEYEIDTMAVHTDAPGGFSIVVIVPKAEDLDAVRAAVLAAAKDHPLALQAFGSVTQSAGHRDDLAKTDATYK